MKLAINLLQLAPGRREGITTYITKLLVHVQPLLTEDEQLYVFHQAGLKLPRFKYHNIHSMAMASPYRQHLWGRVRRKLNRLASKDVVPTRLALEIKKLGIELIHYPFSLIPPDDLALPIPIVLTVVDIQHDYFPEFFSKADLQHRQATYRPSFQKAKKIIAISKYTKDTLIEKYHLSSGKVSVIYLAGNMGEARVTKFKLPPKFIYYPAASWPHKNHVNLLKAFKRLTIEGRVDAKLILTGAVTDHFRKLQTLIKRLGLQDLVLHLGQVTDWQVRQIYLQAKLVAFPSYFEGFGIPVIEAMTYGVPVVCSDTTSLPEIAKTAAVYFDPKSPKDIAEKISLVWNDRKLQRLLVRKGYRQAKRFSWQQTAAETIKLYREIYGQT